MNQKYIVRNKTQLLAAFGCALNIGLDNDEHIQTEIILERKSGKTTFLLEPVYSDRVSGYSKSQLKKYKSALAQIRRTPAECFR